MTTNSNGLVVDWFRVPTDSRIMIGFRLVSGSFPIGIWMVFDWFTPAAYICLVVGAFGFRLLSSLILAGSWINPTRFWLFSDCLRIGFRLFSDCFPTGFDYRLNGILIVSDLFSSGSDFPRRVSDWFSIAFRSCDLFPIACWKVSNWLPINFRLVSDLPSTSF